MAPELLAGCCYHLDIRFPHSYWCQLGKFWASHVITTWQPAIYLFFICALLIKQYIQNTHMGNLYDLYRARDPAVKT